MATTLERDSTVASLARPPSAFDVCWDRTFRGLTHVFAWLTILLVLYILYEIGGKAMPAMQEYGLGFVSGTTWE